MLFLLSLIAWPAPRGSILFSKKLKIARSRCSAEKGDVAGVALVVVV